MTLQCKMIITTQTFLDYDVMVTELVAHMHVVSEVKEAKCLLHIYIICWKFSIQKTLNISHAKP